MMPTMGSFDEDDDELFDGNSGNRKQVWLQFCPRQHLLMIDRDANVCHCSIELLIYIIDRTSHSGAAR